MTEFVDIFAYDLTTTVYLSISSAMLAAYALAALLSAARPTPRGLALLRAR